MMSILDIKGKKFGKLTVTNTSRTSITSSGRDYLCICDCGNSVYVYRGKITTGHTKSCGCITKTLNGKSNTRLYRIWWGIKERCYKTYHNSYKNYGAKGIIMQNSWHDFNTFYEWSIHNGYHDKLTIDRIDSSQNYTEENCQWISLSDNVAKSNKEKVRRKSKYTYIGISPENIFYEFKNASDFARNHNLNASSITRVARGERKSYKGWTFKFSKNLNI